MGVVSGTEVPWCGIQGLSLRVGRVAWCPSQPASLVLGTVSGSPGCLWVDAPLGQDLGGWNRRVVREVGSQVSRKSDFSFCSFDGNAGEGESLSGGLLGSEPESVRAPE